jgi:GAF domain
MERLLQILKDPHKLSLLAAAMFFVGIVTTTIFLYTLPHDLVFKGGMTTSGLAAGVYTKVFVVIAITLALGFVAINASMKVKKEIIVFKEKSENKTNQAAEAEAKTASIDLQTFTDTIKNAKANDVLQLGLNSICQLLQAGQGAFYAVKNVAGKQIVEMRSGFALAIGESEKIEFELGEGLVGQAAVSGKSMYLDELPEGYNHAIVSGLGMATPKYLFIAPVKKENGVKAVMEIATFSPLSETLRKQAEEMAGLLAERV